VIAVRDLRTQFGATIIHDHLDLAVQRGEIVALVGGSGSGKTTLLRAIIMLLRPTAGSIHLFGQEIIGISESAAFRLRRRFGMLFQQGALFSSLTVRENVADSVARTYPVVGPADCGDRRSQDCAGRIARRRRRINCRVS
jgi:phospholipid/cholesterol/gamma-HCH transport system ATP-binding protein